MTRSTRGTLVLAAALAAWCAAPAAAEAQGVLKRLREQTAKRLQQGKAHVDSAVLSTAGGVVDSTVGKTGRAADAGVNKVGAAADGAIARTEQGVAGALGRGGDALAAQLAGGRAVLPEITFTPNSDQLTPEADGVVRRLAKALADATGVFLIEGHTAPAGDAAAAQLLSERRAAALKARLVGDGVPAARLLAVGYGATRPAAGGAERSARIEIARAQ